MKLTLVLLSGLAQPLSAATSTWKGGAAGAPDVWNNAANWTPAGIPASGSDIVFPAGAVFIGEVKNINPSVRSVTVQAPGYTFKPTSSLLAGFSLTHGVTVSYAANVITTFETVMNVLSPQTFTAAGSRLMVKYVNITLLSGNQLTYAGNGIHEVNGGIFNEGNLVKTGTGRLIFNGNIVNPGTVTVQEGSLECQGDVMEKSVLLQAPAVVSGTGRMAALTTAGGMVRPGNGGPGGLKINGALTLDPSAVLEIQFESLVPGMTDAVSASSVSLNGAQLNFTVGDDYLVLIGYARTFITNHGGAPVTGTFGGLPEGATLQRGNVTYRISYTGGDGNDVTLTPIAAAPTGITRVWNGYFSTQFHSEFNWEDGLVPRAGDSILIPPLTAISSPPWLNFIDGFPLHRITFTGGGIELSGGAVHLSDGIVQQAPAGSEPNVVSCGLHSSPLAPARTVRIHLQSGGPLSVTGASGFELPQNTDVLELVNDQPSALILQQKTGPGAGFIRKKGTGPAALKAINNHSGGVRVEAGSLELHHTSSAGSGTVLVESAGTLSAGQPGVSFLVFSNKVRLSGKLQTTPGAGSQLWDGDIECVGGTAEISGAGGGFSLSGAITGGGGFRFTGPYPILLGGPAPGLWAGGTLIENTTVVCSKSIPGVLAIPGNVTITGGDGYLSCLKSNSLGASAIVTVADSARINFWEPHTISGLVLSGGEATTEGAGSLTITGNVTVQAAPGISSLSGKVYTGPVPVTWNVADGPLPIDFIFSGSLGHDGGTAAEVTKLGSGALRVDAAGGTWSDAALTIFAGAVEWNDAPASPGPFGPNVVLAGGQMHGSGRIRSLTATGGTFSPGSTFTCDSLTMSAAAIFHADAGDQVIVEGPVSLSNPTLILSGNSAGYDAPWTLVDHRSNLPVTGNFAAMPEGHTFTSAGAILAITYAANDRNDIALTRLAPPAPVLSEMELLKAATGSGPISTSGTGVPGFTYQLEHSTDLLQWDPAKSETAAPDGSFKLEWAPPAGPRRFFRVRAL